MPGYISEYSYYGLADTEFIEIAVPAGTDVSGYSVYLYDSSGSIVESYSLGTVQNTIAGKDIYVIDNGTPGFNTMGGSGEIWADDGLALVDDSGTVLQFLSHEGYTVTATEGPADGMTSTEVGTVVNMGDSLETNDGGATYTPITATNKGTIACFAPGTLIDTPQGLRRVETLQEGDLVHTLDAGQCCIRWVWSGEEALEEVPNRQKPVQIKAGALGPEQPNRDLILSGQHRVLLGGKGAFGDAITDERIVPAKALTKRAGIRFMKGKHRMTWHHFACAGHQIVRANGAWCESLLLGPVVLSGLDAGQRAALARRFPGVAPGKALNGPAARTCLSVRETEGLLQGLLQQA